MRSSARLVTAWERLQAVSRKTEAGLVSGQAMSDEAKIIGLTKSGSGSERARANSAKTLGWTYIDSGGVWGGILV